MIPSERQVAIYDHWQTTDDNLLVEAVAGSGKTTTLIELVKLCEYRTLFLAFNKSIQVEIGATLEEEGLEQGKAMTMHSMGLSAIRTNTKFRINNNKKYDITRKLQSDYEDLYKGFTWEDKIKLSYTLIDLLDTTKLFLTDDLQEAISHMVDMDKNFYDVAIKDTEGKAVSFIGFCWTRLLEIRDEYYEKPVVEIDFNDMIYLPVKKQWFIPVRPYYLMIDEAQDLNLCQHALIKLLINQGDIKKFIAVGDRRQSIYGFSGAYASSFELFKEYSNTKEFPLDICYRCPSLILQQANDVYDVMQGNKRYDGIVDTVDDILAIKDNSMVICRNSAPLFSVYFGLLGQKRKVIIKGDDILGNLITFMKPMQYKTVSQARLKIEKSISALIPKLKDPKSAYKHHKLKENLGIFNILVSNMCLESTKIIDLIEAIKKIFKNTDEEAIMLCTIHKSKGLQADIVYILNESLIPSKFAKSAKQLEQEVNLKYVARTRAKEEMYYLNLAT